MIIKERHEIVIEKHPYYDSLNKKLMKDLESLEFFTPDSFLKYTNIQGLQTISVKEKKRTSSMVLILEWVTQLLNNHIGFSLRTGAEEFGGKVKYNVWFAKYNKGDYTKVHHHLPAALLGFVYFVNSPPGSSPLVFSTSGKKIKAEEGKVVIFPSSIKHGVPFNRCKNRIIMAGNIGFALFPQLSEHQSINKE